MKMRYRVESSVFADYSTVIVDLDRTILDCTDARGTSIPAFKMEPPFRLLEEDLIADHLESVCRLQPTVRDVLDCLDERGMNLGVVSRSAVEDLADEAQPARMLLAKLDILKYFTYIVVIKAGIQKSDYVRPEGRTLFIDDQDDQLQDVNTRGLADVLSRRKFVNWADLFQESKPERPGPTTVQYFKNAPQPTTSALRSLKFAAPETYTDKSDIDEGIGGSSRNRAEMWGINDHQDVENGRDHVWGEPWEPMDQYFLNETQVTPTVNDKLRVQHPDKGGMAISSLRFESQMSAGGVRQQPPAVPPAVPPSSSASTSPLSPEKLAFLISDLAFKYVQRYSKRLDMNALQVEDQVIKIVRNTLATQYKVSPQVLYDNAGMIEEEVQDAVDRWLTPDLPESGTGTDTDTDTDEWPTRGFSPYQQMDTPAYGDNLRFPGGRYKYRGPSMAELEIEVRTFLLAKFVHEQFSTADVAKIVDAYVPLARQFGPSQVQSVVQELSTKYPTEFSMDGTLMTIGGLPEGEGVGGVDAGGTSRVPPIDVERLKAVTQASIEDFVQYGQPVQTEDGLYVFKDNGADILGVAHLDTRQDVQHFRVTERDRTRVIHNAQLDDRLGVYILLDVLPAMGVHADILLTEGEETGRSTAKYFKPPKQYKWIFSFDRKGMDTVMYDYHDPQTEKLMNDNQFTVGRGSRSDISYLEHLGAKGFNFGIGYDDYHTKDAHVVESHMAHNVQLFKKFYDKHKATALPHTPRPPKPPSSAGSQWPPTAYSSSSLGSQQLAAQVEDIVKKLGTTDVREVQHALHTYYGVSEVDAHWAVIAALTVVGDALDGVRNEEFQLGDTVDVAENPDTQSFRGFIERLPTEYDPTCYLVIDMEDNVWGVEPQYLHKTAAVELPKAEQYPDYMGTTDVSPKDPKGQDELEDSMGTRKELERRYFETGLHDELSFGRQETTRPLTPYAALELSPTQSLSHGEPPPVNPVIHRPNTLLVHEGVLQALTFGEIEKHWAIVRHEARDDYEYRPEMATAVAVDHS